MHRDEVPILFFSVGSLGLATIFGMNIVLFYRILVGDYLGAQTTSKAESGNRNDVDADKVALAKHSSGINSVLYHRRQQVTQNVNRIVRSLFDAQNNE